MRVFRFTNIDYLFFLIDLFYGRWGTPCIYLEEKNIFVEVLDFYIETSLKRY